MEGKMKSVSRWWVMGNNGLGGYAQAVVRANNMEAAVRLGRAHFLAAGYLHVRSWTWEAHQKGTCEQIDAEADWEDFEPYYYGGGIPSR